MDSTAPHSTNELLNQQGICLLIPTYNNATTLREVLKKCMALTTDIIVVNDGSTDHTADILADYPFLKTLHFKENQGKGAALKAGFRLALRLGFSYALTLDSDGQHDPVDIRAFSELLEAQPGAMVIGARNMKQENVPGKSSFGNRFSNFWFWVETGIRLPDTQSGYRMYPLEPLRNMRFYSGKYEFEIEVPVRLAWKNVPVLSVPVGVYYPPPDERISHFRPFKDFARISVLNTFLTLIALLWIHPYRFIKQLFSKKGRKAIWNRVFIAPHETNLTKAKSIGFGVFMGIFPVWGFQLAIGIPLALWLRLNQPLFLLGANISVFPLTPFFWAASLFTGKWLLGYSVQDLNLFAFSLEQFKAVGLAFFLGGAVLAIVAGLCFFLLSYGLFFFLRPKR